MLTSNSTAFAFEVALKAEPLYWVQPALFYTIQDPLVRGSTAHSRLSPHKLPGNTKMPHRRRDRGSASAEAPSSPSCVSLTAKIGRHAGHLLKWSLNRCVCAVGPLGPPQTSLDPGRRAIRQRRQDSAPVFFEEWELENGGADSEPCRGHRNRPERERERAGSEEGPDINLLICSPGGS